MDALAPEFAFDVTLWRRGESSGTLSIGFGRNPETGQLLFYFGNLESDSDETWWMVSERHLRILDFFLGHQVYFDGRLERSGIRHQTAWGQQVHETHFRDADFPEFRRLLEERVELEPWEEQPFIRPKKMYALVAVLGLIISQMDEEERVSEGLFAQGWEYFVDLLE